MANFMGPMAPPQAAPTQPPQLDIRTNPNQRERFRNFMRQNTRPNLAVPAMQPPMMPQAPMPMAPQAPRPPIPMAIRPNAPMPPQPAPMPYGANIDVFSPQYMVQPRPMYLEDGGSVPPRRTEIRGQDHMLAYITPDEAGILEALGGSGEAGPMGIPTYIGGGGDAMGGFGDAGVGNDSGGGPAGSGGASGSGDHSGGEGSASSANASDNDGDRSGGGQDRSGMQSTLESYQSQSAAEKAADFSKAEEAGKAARAAQEAREARELVARTFATSNKGKSLVGAPNSEIGYVTTGKPSESQVADALAAAKSLGMDISNVDPSMASDLGLNDPETTAVEAVTSPTAKSSITSFDDLANLLSAYQTTETPAQQAARAKAAEQAQLTGLFGVSSQTPSTGLTPGYTVDDAELMGMSNAEISALADNILGSSFADSPPGSRQANYGGTTSASSSPSSTQANVDPMTVARAMDLVSPPGIMDIGIINSIGDLLGLTDEDQIRSDYENRAYSSLGMSPGLASAVLGTQTATGPVTGAIGGPRGGIMGGLFGGYTPGAAGMTGMTPDGKSTGAITGDQLANLANRANDPISGFFNNMTLSAASRSNVAVIDPATGNIVGAMDGKGRYTGRPEFNPNTYGQPQGPQGDGPDPVFIPPVVQPPTVTDPRPEDNMLGGMDTLPGNIDVTGVPSTRVPYGGELRLPVGYGDPRTGYISPEAYRTAGFMPPRGPIPIGFFEDGGAVLDQAAGRFLEALTAA